MERRGSGFTRVRAREKACNNNNNYFDIFIARVNKKENAEKN